MHIVNSFKFLIIAYSSLAHQKLTIIINLDRPPLAMEHLSTDSKAELEEPDQAPAEDLEDAELQITFEPNNQNGIKAKGQPPYI